MRKTPHNPSIYSPNQELDTTFFRIFQETLTNIIRHAGATQVAVNLKATDKEIILEAEDYGDAAGIVSIASNYYREIAYNLEHTIHHMALIRVGINEVSSVVLPDEFGVAYSTIKFRQQCAQ